MRKQIARLICFVIFVFSLTGCGKEPRQTGAPIPSSPVPAPSQNQEGGTPSSGLSPGVDKDGYRTGFIMKAYDHCKIKDCPEEEDLETEEDLRRSSLPSRR